ncbi:endonuclease [Noviherbaspirillum sp. UKPF54]|nr:endonuclease [Noviherbaspirillum sp. UKPF54]
MRPRITSVGLVMPPRPVEFEYPAHIDRASIDALPGKPGVYLFRNRHGAPIYIGKSVNIRTRVLSHLRTAEEAAMLQQVRSVDYVRMAGEIGALLLESKLIKQWQPAFNVLLRDVGQMFSIRMDAGGLPQVAGSADPEFSGACLHGLFVSRSAAEQGLRALVRQHGLCPVLTGLEVATRKRACFAHQIGQCRGACIGLESRQAHQARLLRALEQLQASVWPYPGPIGIVEQEDGLRQVHVIDHWSYIDSLQGRRTGFRRSTRMEIDIDVYKILARPLAEGELQIVPLAPRQAKRARAA